ncbi:MAG: hypothetical protein HJJLKODD_00506 [Phycisphaerae bacterium]|nr:hypothetical protein [Phycisphaerae bacterium]
MVNFKKQFKVMRIDLIGCGLVVVALGLTTYFGGLRQNAASAQLSDIWRESFDIQERSSQLQRDFDKYEADYKQKYSDAEKAGKLDDQIPIEDRLTNVRQMATDHGWQDWQIAPGPTHVAVDVRERTFIVTGVATYAQLMQFLHDFEESTTWADISHFRITPRRITGLSDECDVEFTLNFYSSYQEASAGTGAARQKS